MRKPEADVVKERENIILRRKGKGEGKKLKVSRCYFTMYWI